MFDIVIGFILGFSVFALWFTIIRMRQQHTKVGTPSTSHTVNRTFVVANGFRQFESWCCENKVSVHSPLVSYISEGEWYKMQGITNPVVVYYGTYYERNDIYDIELFVKSRMHSNTIDANEHILQQLKPKTLFNKYVTQKLQRKKEK